MDMISIIVPIYNASKTLNKCIESILNQSIDKFELLLINDGSKDDSVKICETYKYDSRVKIYSFENSGVSSTRNKGIELANGKYICFVDADDYCETDHLKELYNSMISSGSELVVCGVNKIKNNGQIIDSSNIQSTFKLSKEESLKDIFYYKYIRAYVYNKMFLKEIIEKHNIRFKEEIFISEDLLFCIEYITKINTYVHLVPSNSYYYVQHEASVINQRENDNVNYSSKWETEIDALDNIRNTIPISLSNYEEIVDLITTRKARVMSKLMKKLYTSGNKRDLIQMYKQFIIKNCSVWMRSDLYKRNDKLKILLTIISIRLAARLF